MYCPASDKFVQPTFFGTSLMNSLDPTNRYILLGNKIDWNDLIDKVSAYFPSNVGRPTEPLRLMVGLNMVKYIENLSDNRVLQYYLENPYVQLFCGAVELQVETPCTDVTLSNFRNKIGEDGCNLLLEASVNIHDLGPEREDVTKVILDTSAQCKNIAYPKDIDLLVKTAHGCVKIAKEYNIPLRNTYNNQISQCLKTVRFEKSTKAEKKKEIRKAKKRIFTMTYALYRDLLRKMTPEQQLAKQDKLDIFKKVIEQSNINKTPVDLLREECNLVLDEIGKCVKVCDDTGISITDRTRDKINNLTDELGKATGRGLEKTLRNILASLKSIANRLVKRIQKYLDDNGITDITDELKSELIRIKDSLAATIKDNRIYSLHEPHVRCITKGKAGVEHEYGSKVSIALTKKSAIIVGACNFAGNTHDSNTVAGTIDNVEESTGIRPEEVWADRGYRGAQDKNPDIAVHIPSNPTADMTKEEKKQAREDFGRRSSIEPVIGHVKNDFRLRRNYLKGEIGDSINLLLACAAFNLKKWMNLRAKEAEEAKNQAKKSNS